MRDTRDSRKGTKGELGDNKNRANEMAQWVKALATKPIDLSSVPGTCRVEGEN